MQSSGCQQRFGGEITGVDMKTSRIPAVEMHLCSCVRYPPIVCRCLKQATCIMWIIPDVAGLLLSSIGYKPKHIEPQSTLSFAGEIIGFNFHPKHHISVWGSVSRQKEEAVYGSFPSQYLDASGLHHI